MARLTPDGFLKLYEVVTISTPAAMTTVELAAGTDLTPFITPAGVNFPEDATDADSSDLSSARDKSVPATIGGDIEGEFYRDDGTGGTTDSAWAALPRLKDTYLVLAEFGGSGAGNGLTTGDSYELWTVRVSQRSRSRFVRGETQRFVSRFANKADPITGTVA